MRRAVVIAVMLSTLLLAETARAAPFTPELELAYAISEEYWGGPPANCTSVDKQTVDAGSLAGGDGSATIPEAPQPCFLYVNARLAKRLNFGRACAVVTHEDGHNHGLVHSEDPASIMYTGWELPVIPACSRTESLLFQAWNLREEYRELGGGYPKWRRAIKTDLENTIRRAWAPLMNSASRAPLPPRHTG